MIWQFGNVELDDQLFEVRRGGQRVLVQQRVIDLLLYLARNSTRLVSHEELMTNVWKKVRVTAASVHQAISQARQIAPEVAACLHTERGRGYRLCPNRPTGFTAPNELGAAVSAEVLEPLRVQHSVLWEQAWHPCSSVDPRAAFPLASCLSGRSRRVTG